MKRLLIMGGGGVIGFVAMSMILLVASRAGGESPVTAAAVNRARRAEIARVVAESRRATPAAALTKAQLREPMHAFVPLLVDCYRRVQARDPQIGGVVNTKLAIDSVAGLGTIFSVVGFDTAGALGQSREFRECVTATAASIVLPPIGGGGSVEITYPITFAPEPPDNRHTEWVDRAQQAAAAGRWDGALTAAERGLESTALDGTFRRALIGVAGVAACHLRRADKARRYYALASTAFEAQIRQACARDANIDLVTAPR